MRALQRGLHPRATDRAANVMPTVLEATRAGATMGEMSGVLRMAYGSPAGPFGMVDDPI